MCPRSAHSKPPPPKLPLLMNPLPDPPEKSYHIISPQISKEKPCFLNPGNSQTKATTLILKKINKLGKKISQGGLPTELTKLLNRLCKK
ncbi:hypothetical protein O181_077710, partial [Austropuccinia psidii MF-1]|nr:hypothetical protein [Austropuccinia psidii MF-1]